MTIDGQMTVETFVFSFNELLASLELTFDSTELRAEYTGLLVSVTRWSPHWPAEDTAQLEGMLQAWGLPPRVDDTKWTEARLKQWAQAELDRLKDWQ